MASIRRKIHHRPTISPTGPHLLKIIPKGTCKRDILRIPKTFLTKCGDDLANPVVLKVPSGSEWKVELRIWDDGVCFGKGWQKFFEFYSLGSCHSLVFQYEGNSEFRVCILNRNLTEIDYPLTISEMSETDEDDGSDDNASEEDSSGDDSVEIFNNFRSWSRTKEKTPLSCARPHNINRRSSSDSDQKEEMPEMEETDEDDDSIEISDDVPPCSKRRKKSPIAPQPLKKKTRGVGGSCKTQSRVNRRPGALKMLERGKHRALQRAKHVGKPSRIQKLLKQGSEITETEKDRALQRAKAFKSDYPSCTVVLRPSYVFAGYLYLDASFTKEHFVRRKQDNVILRALDGRTWPVNLHKQKKTVRLCGGWRSFVQDNHLKAHDVCVFVLINQTELVMDVVIFRAVEAATHTLSPDSDDEQLMSQMKKSDADDDSVEILDDFLSCSTRTKKFPVAPQPHQHKRIAENNTKYAASSSRTQKLFKRRPESMQSGKDRALQRAKAFKSDYPSCRVVLRPSYIAGYLYLGARFTKKHLLNRQGDTVILRVDGRTWTVQLWKHDKMVRFRTGWKPFVQDNHLEIGDMCVFVLVNEIKLLMDVIIFRAGEAAERTLSPAYVLVKGNRQSRSVQIEHVEDELDADGEMEADQYLTVDTTSESE